MYVVIENTPGYLPEDDDPGVYETLEAAKEALAEEVQRYVEQFYPEITHEYGAVWVNWADDHESCNVSTTRPHDLGRVFEIVESED